MSNTVFGVAVDCSDAAAVARFWGAVLGRTVADGADGANAVLLAGDNALSGPRMGFHQVPEAKSVKNRFHLDLITTDFEAESDRILALGATRLNDVQRTGARWTTFADIEGNEFDLISG
jgi:predicted enzyme related to lactoylglutathione lyase